MTEFHTSNYESSHGKKPRGAGAWAFQKCDSGGRPDWNEETFFAPYGSMAECKKAVKAAHPEWDHVSVAP